VIHGRLVLTTTVTDNAQALIQVLCPAAYGPHNASRYSVLLLLPQVADRRTKEQWRGAVACDGMVVIEGPPSECKSQAMNTLLDSTAAKLARTVPRAWEEASYGEDDECSVTNVERDNAGCSFASERRRR
jgi:hypothetical protein